MGATVAIVLFLVVICGGMTLMLTVGYVSVEKERARLASQERPELAVSTRALTAVPGFFASLDTPIPSGPFVLDDALVRRLEQHVRSEQAVVARFVHHPSVDNLYRSAGTSLHVH